MTSSNSTSKSGEENSTASPVTDKPVPEVLKKAEDLKESGNEQFKQSKFSSAIETYSQCLSQLSAIQLETVTLEEEKKRVTELKLSCLKNSAACGLKLKDWTRTVEFATKALELDSNDAKALFRRCQVSFDDLFFPVRFPSYFTRDTGAAYLRLKFDNFRII